MRYLALLTKRTAEQIGKNYPNTLLVFKPGFSQGKVFIQFKNYKDSGKWSEQMEIPAEQVRKLADKYGIKGYDRSEDSGFLEGQAKKKETWAYVENAQQYANLIQESEKLSQSQKG